MIRIRRDSQGRWSISQDLGHGVLSILGRDTLAEAVSLWRQWRRVLWEAGR